MKFPADDAENAVFSGIPLICCEIHVICGKIFIGGTLKKPLKSNLGASLFFCSDPARALEVSRL